MNKQVEEAECPKCSATGVYHGLAEEPGIGIVCATCGGTGKITVEFVPFSGRAVRSDIKEVELLNLEKFIAEGVGHSGIVIPYDDFLAGKFPEPQSEVA